MGTEQWGEAQPASVTPSQRPFLFWLLLLFVGCHEARENHEQKLDKCIVFTIHIYLFSVSLSSSDLDSCGPNAPLQSAAV